MEVDILTSTNKIMELFTNDERHYPKLTKGQFLQATSCNFVTPQEGPNLYRLSHKSKLYRAQIFTSPTTIEMEQNYYNADIVPLSEAMNIKEYSRFSVQGTVSYVSPIKTSEKSERRDVEITDPNNDKAKIRVTLWKRFVNNNIQEKHSITMKNITMKPYKGRPQYNSTQNTSIKVEYPKKQHEITISSFDQHESNMLLLFGEDQTEYKIEQDLLFTKLQFNDLDDLQASLPLTIRVSSTDINIDDIKTE
ncbi:uncharacterized protein LOC119733779 [Patiria miniata]|uniref:Uncharacterized protein n=1 Tax=Patiria miniata TaxID=46514 RepID=A0A914AI54_PATMI|nr:uncharacterized protein LOC119733779 [Patiria miniata]